ncbi:hypothetical protein [Chitinimonas naiadis]
MTDIALPTPLIADRKAQLLREGATYRQGMVLAKITVGESLHKATLLQRTVGQLAAMAVSAPVGVVLPLAGRWLPLAIKTSLFLARKRWLFPLLGIGVVTVATVTWLRQRPA